MFSFVLAFYYTLVVVQKRERERERERDLLESSWVLFFGKRAFATNTTTYEKCSTKESI